MTWNEFKTQWVTLSKDDTWDDKKNYISKKTGNGAEFRIYENLTVAYGIWGQMRDARERFLPLAKTKISESVMRKVMFA